MSWPSLARSATEFVRNDHMLLCQAVDKYEGEGGAAATFGGADDGAGDDIGRPDARPDAGLLAPGSFVRLQWAS